MKPHCNILQSKLNVALIMSLVFFAVSCGDESENRATIAGGQNLASCIDKSANLPDSICPDTAPFTDILAMQKVEECNGQGVVYDRNNNQCSEAKTNFDCNYVGVKAAFVSTVTQIENQLKTSVGSPDNPEDFGEGYLFDQCGTFADGTPIAYLIKLVPGDPAKVLVRKLGTGSPLLEEEVE